MSMISYILDVHQDVIFPFYSLKPQNLSKKEALTSYIQIIPLTVQFTSLGLVIF